ncbi:MAG: TolC family outer membrane protein [Burkholderiales bacterium]
MTKAKLRLAAVAAGLAFAGAAAAADFLANYRLAKQNDAQFASARASLEAGLEKLPQGRALLLPVINAAGNTTWNDAENKDRTQNQVGSAQFNSNGWNVTLTQPLFRWQNLVQYQQSQFQVLQAEAQFGQATQDLIVRVAQAYFDVLAAMDNLEFTKSNRVVIAEQLAQAKRNFEVGTATITDTNEAQARYDLAIAQEIAGVNALEVAQRALQQIIGQFPDALTPLRSAVMIDPPQPNLMDEWVKSARGNNFVVRGNEAVMEIASREVGRQRAGHYPTLDVVAGAQENTNQNIASVTGIVSGSRSSISQNTIGLQLNVPIYAGGSVMSRTREAVGLKEKARQDLDSSRRAAEFNARQSFLNVTNGIAQVRALEQALRSSEVSLQSNRVGYEVGVRINIDVLNAQQQVFQTQRDLARARYDTILNGLRLKSASGSLTESDVEAVNRLLGYDQKPATPAPRSEQLERSDRLARAEESPALPRGPLDLTVPGAVAPDAPVMPSAKPAAASPKTPPAPRKLAAAKPKAAPARVQPVAARPAPLAKPVEPLPADEAAMVPAPMAKAIDEPVAPVGKPLIEAAAVTTPSAEPGEDARVIRYVEPKVPGGN